MAKRKKRAEAEPETGANNSDERVTEDQKLDFFNGDPQQSKKEEKKKKRAALKPTKYLLLALPSPAPSSTMPSLSSLLLECALYPLAGQIARAATIFRIDEIVVFDNKINSGNDAHVILNHSDENESGAAFLVRILRVCCPHLMRHTIWASMSGLPIEKGITLNEKATNSSATVVDVGLSKNVMVEQELELGMRVTLAMGTNRNLDSDLPHPVVSSSKPREDRGMYWGYKVRYASNINSVFKDCPYKGGYDHLIGTSEHGLIVSSSQLTIPAFRHLLIAFGGLAGLEESIEEDDNLKVCEISDPSSAAVLQHARERMLVRYFDLYLNTCPHQGSRTIRTEEAIFISLQYFQEPIARALQRAEK